MPPLLALAACVLLVTVLLAVEHKGASAVSRAVWLPTCWMLIAGSRPVGRWLSIGSQGVLQEVGEGSAWDRTLLGAMIVVALTVCVKRRLAWYRFLRENTWVVVLFAYMGVSILWSDFPLVSLKRWVRSAGPVVMAAMVLTEGRPIEAVGSILRRCAYVLIPTSVVLIKYFPHAGRAYGRWTGGEMWTGVATQKNGLGQLCAVSAVFLVWSLISGRGGTADAADRWRTWADGAVLAVAAYLLIGPGGGGFSATSVAVAVAGILICVTLRLIPGLARAVTANARLLVLALVIAYLCLGSVFSATTAELLGRRADLTGRAVDIWPKVLDVAARHPILGTGYGGVWGLGDELSVSLQVEEAHNGYLDAYLQLGLVGAALLGAFLVSIAGKVRSEAARDIDWASVVLSLLILTMIYNLTESAFFDAYLGGVMIIVAAVSAVDAQLAWTRRAGSDSGRITRRRDRLAVQQPSRARSKWKERGFKGRIDAQRPPSGTSDGRNPPVAEPVPR